MTITCPSCGHVQEAGADAAGRAHACAKCGNMFRVDAPAANPYATPESLKERPAGTGPTSRGLPPPGVVSFEQGFSRGWANYTSHFGPLVLVSLVFCAIQFGVALLQQIPLLGVLVALAAPFTITPVVTAGFNLATLKIHDGGEGKVDDLFVEFRALGELAMLVLVQVGIWLAAIVPGLIIAAIGAVPWLIEMDRHSSADPEIWQMVMMGVGSLVLLVTVIIVSMGFLWSYVAFVDRRAGFWDAVKTSWALTRNNPGGTFAIMFVGGLLAGLGAIACLVGLIFTLPIFYAAVIGAYRSAQPRIGERDVPAVY